MIDPWCSLQLLVWETEVVIFVIMNDQLWLCVRATFTFVRARLRALQTNE